MSEVKTHQGISRRSFLKTSAAAAGVSALGSGSITALAADEERSASPGGEKVFSGCCRPNCQQLCRINIHVRDGKIVRTSMAPLPDECYNRICIKGLSHVQRVYNKDRILHPMRRVEGTPRGGGEWEQVSWDEAMDTIVSHWSKYEDKRSILLGAWSANYALVNGANGITKRLFNTMETSYMDTFCDVNMVYGFMRTIGYRSIFWNTNEFSTLHEARNIFVWGANPTESGTQDWHFVSEAQEGGTFLTVIDPNYTTAASKADEWIPIRPASDTALALAMVKMVIDEDWIDHDYAAAHTVAPFLVKDTDGTFLRMSDLVQVSAVTADESTGAEVNQDSYVVYDEETQQFVAVDTTEKPALFGAFDANGVKVRTALTVLRESIDDYTPEYAEQLTEVPAEKVEVLTRRYVNGPSTIYTMYGPDRYKNGYMLAHAMATLACLTGNIGKPGAACGLNTFWAYIGQDASNTYDGRTFTHVVDMDVPNIIKNQMYAGKPYPQIKSIYLMCNNALGNYPCQNAWYEAFDKLDLIVCSDLTWNDTTRYADIVLPAAFWFEVEDVGNFGTHPFLIYQEKAIEPLGEAKSDSDIARLLAEKMGYGYVFENFSDVDYIKDIFKNAEGQVDVELSWEKLKAEKVIRHSKYPVMYAKDGAFLTGTGRAEFYVEHPFVFLDWGQEFHEEDERLPRFFEPSEAWPTNPLHDKYPYVCISEHVRWSAHTQWNETPIIKELTGLEPIGKMNPQDAASLHLNDGDSIKLRNDRGSVVVKLQTDPGIRPGLIVLPRAWHRSRYKAGGYQELTTLDMPSASGNAIFFDTLVGIEKYEEA